MSLRAYLVVMGFSTILAACTFGLVLFRIDPGMAGYGEFALFYGSLFLAIVGLFSLIGFSLRVARNRNELLNRHVATAFRQSILVGVLVTSSFCLRARHLLSWWNALFLVILLCLVEFIFISFENRSKNRWIQTD